MKQTKRSLDAERLFSLLAPIVFGTLNWIYASRRVKHEIKKGEKHTMRNAERWRISFRFREQNIR